MQKNKIFLNTFSSIVNQIIVVICGLILPKLFLIYYGSEVNGLVSSITQFLSFVTFLEMGMGAVIQSNLYRPLADCDFEQLSRVMKSAKRFYKIIALFFSFYIVILCVIYPFTVREEFDYVFTASLVFIISISMLMQYYFGAVNQFLLSADQKSYIPLGLQSVTLIVNTVICYLLMKNGQNIQIVKLGTAAIYLVRPFSMYYYVNHKYKIDYSIVLTKEPINQKWNGIAQHIAAMVLEHTDVVLLTLFSTLTNVSIYTVYYNVINGIRRLFSTVIDSLRATFGRLLAIGDKKKLDEYFALMESGLHFIYSLAFGCTISLIIPFVSVYTRGVNDANYIYPLFSLLITIAYLFYCMRCFYNMPVLAAGHYKETQNAAIIECLINLVISITLVRVWGLIGVAIGTLIAMLYRVIYLAVYLSKNILYRNLSYFIKHFVLDLEIVLLTYFTTNRMQMTSNTYFDWIVLAILKFLICFGIDLCMHIIFDLTSMKRIMKKIVGGSKIER